MLFFISMLFIMGCSSKSTKLPKNVTKLQKITSLNQFDGCYLAKDNIYYITNIMSNTTAPYLNKKYMKLISKTYKTCFKSLDNELFITAYDKNGKFLKKSHYELGKEISLSLNALVFDSEYNILKASDVGLFVGPNYKRKYFTLNTNNDLIFSNNSFASGIAIAVFLPIPIYSSEQYSSLIKRIK